MFRSKHKPCLPSVHIINGVIVAHKRATDYKFTPGNKPGTQRYQCARCGRVNIDGPQYYEVATKQDNYDLTLVFDGPTFCIDMPRCYVCGCESWRPWISTYNLHGDLPKSKL